MDQAAILDLKKIISDNTNILLVLPNLVNTDLISASSTFYNFLNKTLKKHVFIASSEAIPENLDHILDMYGIEQKEIIKEIKPLQYVINIPHKDKDLEINVEKGDTETNILMLPKNEELDVNKITVNAVGTRFNLIVLVGVRKLEEIGDLYKSSKREFDRAKLISIGSDFIVDYTNENLYSEEYSTVSESISQIIEGFGAHLDQISKDVLFEGIIKGTDGLHRVKSSKAFDTIIKFVPEEQFPSRLSNLVYKLNSSELELKRKIFNNLVIKENVVYSSLNDKDLGNINPDIFNGMDYLPFDLVEGVDTYLLSYYDGKTYKTLIYSSKLDEILGKLKSNDFQISRSTTLIQVISDKKVENIVNLLSGNLFDSSNTKPEPQQSSEVEKTEEKQGNKAAEPVQSSTPLETPSIATADMNNPLFTQANSNNPSNTPFEKAK